MIAAPLGEIRLAVSTIRHLARVGQLDQASLNTALALIDEYVEEIEVLAGPAPQPAGMVFLPVMTLADIATAEGQRPASGVRCKLTVVDGGRT